MNTPTTVIYHKADFDGLFCREIAHKFLPNAELIGWDYGDPEPVVPDSHQLYILDLSVPTLMGHPNLIWIDHHKSAIDKWDSTTSTSDWTVSLYHAPGKEHIDLSVIATKHGGGGHRGACGFRTNTLPFLTPTTTTP